MTASVASVIERSEVVPGFEEFGIRAFTTTRAVGNFGLLGSESVGAVFGRYNELREELRAGAPHGRLATAGQVHGATVIVHRPGWIGWLRAESADGHVSIDRGTALAVTIADCVPVFIAHPSGAIAILHSGWRGTVARIVEHGIAALSAAGLSPSDMRAHTGPAICGKCYEVSAEVYARLTGHDPGRPTPIDLRAIIADHARAMGVREITTSSSCTRCDNVAFFSHRCGDEGRQLGVMIADS